MSAPPVPPPCSALFGTQRRAYAFLAALLLLTACKHGQGDDSPRGDPGAAVPALFSAIGSKDCDAIKRASGGAFLDRLRKEGCEGIVEHDLPKDLKVRVLSSEQDGRNPDRFFVEFEASDGQRTRTKHAQVQWVEGAYRVVEF